MFIHKLCIVNITLSLIIKRNCNYSAVGDVGNIGWTSLPNIVCSLSCETWEKKALDKLHQLITRWGCHVAFYSSFHFFFLFWSVKKKWSKIEWHATLLSNRILSDSMASNLRKNLCPRGGWELPRCLDHSLHAKLAGGSIFSSLEWVADASIRLACYNQSI